MAWSSGVVTTASIIVLIQNYKSKGTVLGHGDAAAHDHLHPRRPGRRPLPADRVRGARGSARGGRPDRRDGDRRSGGGRSRLRGRRRVAWLVRGCTTRLRHHRGRGHAWLSPRSDRGRGVGGGARAAPASSGGGADRGRDRHPAAPGARAGTAAAAGRCARYAGATAICRARRGCAGSRPTCTRTPFTPTGRTRSTSWPGGRSRAGSTSSRSPTTTRSATIDCWTRRPPGTPCTLLPGQEVTTARGHANAFGPVRWVDFRRPVETWFHQVAADGGLLSVNHPLADDCAWQHPWVVSPPAVEALHVSWFRALTDTAPWGYLAVLDRLADEHGVARPVLLGGSDYHRPEHRLALGTPITWVAAADDSPAAVLEALRAGRTALTVGLDPARPFGPDRRRPSGPARLPGVAPGRRRAGGRPRRRCGPGRRRRTSPTGARAAGRVPRVWSFTFPSRGRGPPSPGDRSIAALVRSARPAAT